MSAPISQTFPSAGGPGGAHFNGLAGRTATAADAVIVGGGAIGKTSALALAQAGLQVVLVTGRVSGTGSQHVNADAVLPVDDPWNARVYALNHDARTLLASLRVWDALDHSRIAPVENMVVDGDAAQRAGRLHFDAFAARVEALAWIVEDDNLNHALDAALRFAPGVRIVASRAVSLDVGDTQAVLSLENGDAVASALVVGADGGNSWVRSRCGIDLALRSYGQQAIVTNFRCALPHHDTAYQRFAGDEGIVALLPLPGERVSLVWSAPDALAEDLMAMTPAIMAERVAEIVGNRLGALTPLQPAVRRAFPLTLLRPQAMTALRVALVGDAAHVIHPLAGQGMNLGFADVAALMRAVAERGPHRDAGDVRVLGRYARARKEDVLLMQIATDGLARLFDANAGLLQTVRNLGMNVLDSLPGVKRRLIARALGVDGAVGETI